MSSNKAAVCLEYERILNTLPDLAREFAETVQAACEQLGHDPHRLEAVSTFLFIVRACHLVEACERLKSLAGKVADQDTHDLVLKFLDK